MGADSDADSIIGADAVSREGEKLGRVSAIFRDRLSGEPAWVSIESGMFGRHHHLAPLLGSRLEEGRLVLAYHRDAVADAQPLHRPGVLTAEEESRLHSHYYHAGGEPQVPQRADAESGDYAEQVGEVHRTDRPAGDFIREAEDPGQDGRGGLPPTYAERGDAGKSRR